MTEQHLETIERAPGGEDVVDQEAETRAAEDETWSMPGDEEQLWLGAGPAASPEDVEPWDIDEEAVVDEPGTGTTASSTTGRVPHRHD